jgi:hypothetical protein
MGKYLTKSFGIPRLGMGTVLLVLFAFTPAGVFCVSSARGGMVAQGDFSTAAGGPLTDYAASSCDPNAAGTPGITSSGGTTYPSAAGSVNYSSLTAMYSAELAQNINSATVNWSYAINGGGIAAISPANTITADGPYTDTLGVGCSAGQTLALYMTLSGVPGNAGGDAQTLTLGNHTINGEITPVSEPIITALAIFGLFFVGGSAGRFYLAHRRPTRAADFIDGQGNPEEPGQTPARQPSKPERLSPATTVATPAGARRTAAEPEPPGNSHSLGNGR